MFLPFFNFWSSILIFLFLFHKLFITLFISILVAKESIRLLVSFLPLSYKKSFLSPRIPCWYYYWIFARNFGISAVFPKSLMHLCSLALDWAFLTTLNSCFSRWLIIPNPSASRLILHWLRFLPLILPASNSMLRKTIPKLSMHLSENWKFITKISLMLTLIRWLTVLCLHRRHPVPTQSNNTSTDISVMRINLPSLPMVWVSSGISLFWMMTLKQLIRKWR